MLKYDALVKRDFSKVVCFIYVHSYIEDFTKLFLTLVTGLRIPVSHVSECVIFSNFT